jgi:hypothetical protein
MLSHQTKLREDIAIAQFKIITIRITDEKLHHLTVGTAEVLHKVGPGLERVRN